MHSLKMSEAAHMEAFRETKQNKNEKIKRPIIFQLNFFCQDTHENNIAD